MQNTSLKSASEFPTRTSIHRMRVTSPPSFTLQNYSTGCSCLALQPFRLITTFLPVTLTFSPPSPESL
jgi:hypothetical protein